MAKNPHLQMSNRIMVCREYAEIWQAYFQMFSDDLADKQITEQMEREFENVIGVLALNNYKFVELVGEYMKDSGQIVKTLAQTSSLADTRDMPEATFSKLQIEWHTTFIDMNKALGRLISRLSKKELEAMQMAENQA